jgi:hypothetical protein
VKIHAAFFYFPPRCFPRHPSQTIAPPSGWTQGRTRVFRAPITDGTIAVSLKLPGCFRVDENGRPTGREDKP